jgi:hypothetical protein
MHRCFNCKFEHFICLIKGEFFGEKKFNIIKIHETTIKIPLEIKKLLAEKRKGRATWQRSHTPLDKTAFNRLSKHLKPKLQAMSANSLKNYVSTLSCYDNSIWKPIKSSRKPILASPLRLETSTQDRWTKSDKEKATVLA